MDSKTIYINIILPIIIGPLFVFLKTIYDNFKKNKTQNQLIIYDKKIEKLNVLLNEFYWNFYIKLLCINKLYFTISMHNEFEYISDSDNDDGDCDCENDNDKTIINIKNNDYYENVKINIGKVDYKDIIIDKKTFNLLLKELNKLFDDLLELIESNIIYFAHNINLNNEITNFIIYCKFRKIINEGSPDCNYNIQYFGVKNNISKLLNIISKEVLKYQNQYNTLVNNGPFD